MKSTLFIKFAIAISAIGSLSTPVLAQQQPTITSLQQPTASTSLIKPEASITGNATELTVFFPLNIRIETDDTQHYPVTLFLAQDIVNSEGELIAPINSPVRAQLVPAEGGLKIVADSIVVSGQSIALRAVSPLLPSIAVTQATGDQNGRRQAGVFRDVAGGIAGALGADLAASDQASFGGSVFGFLMGSSSPQNIRTVNIPAGTVHILSVE